MTQYLDGVNAEPILITEDNYSSNGEQRFHLVVFQEGPKGRIIRHKQWKMIISELHKKFPFTKRLFDFKGRPKLFGLWDNVNMDLAQFSTNFPNAMFEVTRFERAMVTKGDVTKLRDLVTKIDVLNGSINVFTLVEKDMPTTEKGNAIVKTIVSDSDSI